MICKKSLKYVYVYPLTVKRRVTNESQFQLLYYTFKNVKILKSDWSRKF